MPYIKQEDRVEFDKLIDLLVEEVAKKSEHYDYDGAFAGLLNYTCSELVMKIRKRLFGKVRYWQIAIINGVFKNIGDEFYRRVAVPYEEIQILGNGDISTYKEINKKTEKKC